MNYANLDAGHGPQSVRCSGTGRMLWGIMVLGVYITFKLLDIADLTVDGSFALGGCVCATLIVGRGMNPVAALFIATLAGMAAGFVTGILHTVLRYPSILAGILTQISLVVHQLCGLWEEAATFLSMSKSIVTMVSSATGFNQAQASQVIGIAAAILMAVVIVLVFRHGDRQRPEGNGK
ncbi:MAG: ABC transporter permease subunit [Enterocloster sp.]